jgi:hypothetical protein
MTVFGFGLAKFRASSLFRQPGNPILSGIRFVTVDVDSITVDFRSPTADGLAMNGLLIQIERREPHRIQSWFEGT